MIVANVITDFTDWLNDISGRWWFLLVILTIAFVDSVIPIVPSETAVIVGGVAAGLQEQNLFLVIICGAVGAFLGDNFAYLLGHRFSPWINRRAETRPKLANRLEWARNQIRARGGPLLVTARFIPGGRTALTITSGLTHQPRRWFASWIAVAAIVWASYAATLGYIFGDRFNERVALWLAFGAALSITLLIELVRHLRSKGKEEPGGAVIGEVAEEVAEEVVEEVTERDPRP